MTDDTPVDHRPTLWQVVCRLSTAVNDLTTLAYIEGCGSGRFSQAPPPSQVRHAAIETIEQEGERTSYNVLLFFRDGLERRSKHATIEQALLFLAGAVMEKN